MTEVLMTRVEIACHCCGNGDTIDIYRSTILREEAGILEYTLCNNGWVCGDCMDDVDEEEVADEDEDGWEESEEIGLEEDEDE
jgi:hypothetical protein